jgi:glycosyltransferase involved in cell wall biosynthesis
MEVTLLWTVLGAYALLVAGWWFRHIVISLLRPLGLYVDPYDKPPESARVTLVIPAKNERERIRPCIETLMKQGPVIEEIIVVDDRSDDGTGDFVREIAGDDTRVRVIRVDTLPEGWSGKTHACYVGGCAVKTDWVLFTDADTSFLPGGVAGALRYAEERDVEMLSLWVRVDHRSFWEHVIIPLAGAVLVNWFLPHKVNNPKSKIAYASGQFILMQKQAYDRIGGHSCVKNTIIEDVPMAQCAKRAGLRLRVAMGPDVMATRMYTCWREIASGWRRIFIGALQRPWRVLVSVVPLTTGSLLPSVGAPLAALDVVLNGLPAPGMQLAFYVLLWLHFVAVYTVMYRLLRFGHCDTRYLLFYPVSVVVVIWMLLDAWWWMVSGHEIVWRGSVTGPAAAGAEVQTDAVAIG